MSEKRVVNNDLFFGEVCRSLSEGKRVTLRAKGESMRPCIHDSDMIVIAPAGDLRMGDVVLARIDEERYVVHRIVAMKGEYVSLMGDANLYGMERCDRQDVSGRVIAVIRDGVEHNIISERARFKAACRHYLLPLRRLAHGLKNQMKRLIK